MVLAETKAQRTLLRLRIVRIALSALRGSRRRRLPVQTGSGDFLRRSRFSRHFLPEKRCPHGILEKMAAGTVPDTSEKGFLGEKRDGIVKVILNPLTPQIRILIRIRYHFETITYADICPQGCRGEAEPVFSPAFQVSTRLTPPPPKRHGRGHGGRLLDAERGSTT